MTVKAGGGLLSPQAPIPLNSAHQLDRFDCGEESLNDWLKKRALKNQATGASKTFVVCDSEGFLCGYYSLAAGAVFHRNAPGRIRRNMPDPIPVAVLGRLAVDKTWQGKGLGADLVADAIKRTIEASSQIGVRCLVVHALSESAWGFYKRIGFRESPTDPLDLLITLEDAVANL